MYHWITAILIFSMISCTTPNHPPINPIQNTTTKSNLKNSSWDKPIHITSRKEASIYFIDNRLTQTVDFKKQSILIFNWQGSGGDTLMYKFDESSPQKVLFSLKRGMTRDIRKHTKVYVLNSDVIWSIKRKQQ